MRKKEIYELIRYYFGLPKGLHILHPDANVRVAANVFLSRRSLKHIVEERKIDGYSLKKIKIMFCRIQKVLKNPELQILNTNQKYVGSFISGRLYQKNFEALLVIHITEQTKQRVINAYYRPNSKFFKMKRKQF